MSPGRLTNNRLILRLRGCAMARWVLLGLLLVFLAACKEGDPTPWQWGGPPSQGPGSQYQSHHYGDPP